MLSYLFLGYAVVHLAIWFWGWTLWFRTGRPVSLFIVLFSGALLFWDNFRIGMGRFIGEGELLYNMTLPAFAWHWAFLPLIIIAAGCIARQADLAFAQRRVVMGLYCVVAVVLIAVDVPKLFGLTLHPACLADTLRYTTNVPATQLCNPSDPVVSGGAGAAAAAIGTNLVVLATGIALWVRRRWPWLAAGAGIMFVAAAATGRSALALPLANFGEICFTVGLIVTAAHFARPDRSRASADT